MLQLSNDAIVLIAGGRYGIRRVGDCMLVAMPRTEMDDAEYVRFTDVLQDDVVRHGGFRNLINYSPTQAPNSRQRKLQTEPQYTRLLACINEVERGIIISDSLMIRGAMTALKWLQVGPKSHDVVSVAHYRKGIEWAVGADCADVVEEGLHELLAATKHAPLRAHDLRSQSGAY